jgi:hypothetical protein
VAYHETEFVPDRIFTVVLPIIKFEQWINSYVWNSIRPERPIL